MDDIGLNRVLSIVVNDDGDMAVEHDDFTYFEALGMLTSALAVLLFGEDEDAEDDEPHLP